jgi:hypothetical protein
MHQDMIFQTGCAGFALHLDLLFITCRSTLLLKGTVSRDFFASGFFHESVSPQPQSIPFGLFQIFLKICGDIRKSRCITGINYTAANFATSFASVDDNGGK